MSSITNLPFSPSKSDPSLSDLLELLKKDILLGFNSHHIATIQSFNPLNQTASATVNYKKTFYTLNQGTGQYSATLVDYPVLVDCPVISIGGGPCAMTMPIAQGDECLVLFNDRDMNNWFQGAANGATATARLHSFADGIIIVGLRSFANVLSLYDPQRSVMRGGTARVGVNPLSSKVLITNFAPIVSGNNLSYSTTLNTLLQNLITAIENIVTVGGDTVSPASKLAINTIAGEIAGLLE